MSKGLPRFRFNQRLLKHIPIKLPLVAVFRDYVMKLLLSALLLAMAGGQAHGNADPISPVTIAASSSVIVLLHADPNRADLKPQQTKALSQLQATPGFKPVFVGSSSLTPADQRAMERHNLTRYYRVNTEGRTAQEVQILLHDLKLNALVAKAYLEPVPVSLDQGHTATLADITVESDAQTPPDHTGKQYYKMSPSPVSPFKLGGLNALELRRYAGGKGENVRIISDESDHWSFEHLDLPKPFITHWNESTHQVGSHDTSSAGIMFSLANDFGTEGFAPAAQAGYTKYGTGGLFDLGKQLKPGDVVQVGVQYVIYNMPLSVCGKSTCMLPVEDSGIVFDEISWLTEEKGVHVIIAAGNGNANLDDTYFSGEYDRSQRDSGAIFAGAINPQTGERSSFSNYGGRVSLSSWGQNVTSTSYSAANPTSLYTDGFSGTSSANPIIAGAVAQLQSVANANGIGPIPPKKMRELLEETGHALPSPDAQRSIGVQPDLKQAVEKMFQEYGGTMPSGQLASPNEVEAGAEFTLKAVLFNPNGQPTDYAWHVYGFEGTPGNEAEITLTAPDVAVDTRFMVAVDIMRSGQKLHLEETLLVKATSDGSCTPTDPTAGQHPLWDASKTYIDGDTVQYNGLVWRAGWHTSGTSPDKIDAFTLISDLPTPWQAGKPYLAGQKVIYESKLYQAKYWVMEPPPATAWSLLGDNTCPLQARQ
jgi:hypothetical protein